MKKIISLILALVMIMSLSVTAFAAESNTIETDGSSATINVKGTFEGAESAGTRISVDVAWSGMEFTYSEAEKEWDPSIHDYKNKSGAGWSTNKGTITVKNHSNAIVTATFSFTPAVEGVIGTFNESILELPSAVGTSYGFAPDATVEFGISGAAITETKDTLGTITVTIAKKTN